MATRQSCPICRHVGSISSCKNGFYCCGRCGIISQIWEVDPETLYDVVQVDRRGAGKTVIKNESLTSLNCHGDAIRHTPLQAISSKQPTVTDRIEEVLDVDSFETRSKSSDTKYLVKWRDRPYADCTWINEVTFRNTDPEYYENYVDMRTSSSDLKKLTKKKL